MRLLSERVPDHPVILHGLHTFAVWGNRLAFERAGITKDTQTPSGGEIKKDAVRESHRRARQQRVVLADGRGAAADRRATGRPDREGAGRHDRRRFHICPRGRRGHGVDCGPGGTGEERPPHDSGVRDARRQGHRARGRVAGARSEVCGRPPGGSWCKGVLRRRDGIAWRAARRALCRSARPLRRGWRGIRFRCRETASGDDGRVSGVDSRDRRSREPRGARFLRGRHAGVSGREGNPPPNRTRPASFARRREPIRHARRDRLDAAVARGRRHGMGWRPASGVSAWPGRTRGVRSARPAPG